LEKIKNTLFSKDIDDQLQKVDDLIVEICKMLRCDLHSGLDAIIFDGTIESAVDSNKPRWLQDATELKNAFMKFSTDMSACIQNRSWQVNPKIFSHFSALNNGIGPMLQRDFNLLINWLSEKNNLLSTLLVTKPLLEDINMFRNCLKKCRSDISAL